MKIGICDDNGQDLQEIAKVVEAYRSSRKVELTYTCYQSASALLDALNSGAFELVLLDVLMPGITGMQVAREIRNRNLDVEFVFLTSSPEYAVESYSVRAHYYLLKPITSENLFPVLVRLMDHFRRPEEVLRIKTQSHVFSMPYGKIEYMEVMSKKLYSI